MNIVISGASGLVGTALQQHLRNEGHTVVSLVRRAPKNESESEWNPSSGEVDDNVLSAADAVINLSGSGIGDRRWTQSYRRTLLESRTATTSLLSASLAKLSSDGKQRSLLNASAIGIYGDRGDDTVDEASEHGSGFLADICLDWEAATSPAESAGVRVVHLRTGIVMSKNGGVLKKLLPLFKLGLGGRLGSGRQWQSWISIDDEVGAICHLLTSDLHGPVNLTAPNPVTNREFTASLGKAVRRPTVFSVPGFAPKLLVGSEFAEQLLLTGQRVLPTKLEESGYVFAHSTLDEAFAALL
ncbi:MAG: TIGR01777 family oxidoreductase [Ilumatobacteraceae bacterium]